MNLLKIHGSLTWELDSNSQETIIRKNKNDIKDPMIVYPSSDKYEQSYKAPYFELFAKFQELLKQPNTLFVTVGFSFADNHISRMVVNALKSNDSLAMLVTDFDIDPEQKNENMETLDEMIKNHYRITMLKATMDDDLRSFFGDNSNED